MVCFFNVSLACVTLSVCACRESDRVLVCLVIFYEVCAMEVQQRGRRDLFFLNLIVRPSAPALF